MSSLVLAVLAGFVAGAIVALGSVLVARWLDRKYPPRRTRTRRPRPGGGTGPTGILV